MRLLFVADGRSPIALNWIDYFIKPGHEVHLVSTFPCPEDARLASLSFVPVAFSGAKTVLQGKSARVPVGRGSSGRLWTASTLPLRTMARQWLGPLTLAKAARRLERIISSVRPDLIHAMRVPFEGMLAALAESSAPLLISVWGNDFTLHASATPLIARYTRLALSRADALHTDCQRDQELAYSWGFSRNKPVAVLPGAGGVQPEIFYPPTLNKEIPEGEGIIAKREAGKQRAGDMIPNGEKKSGIVPRERDLTIINPRGFRAYVRNDTFFKAISLVLQRQPKARFICPAMAEEPRAWRWVKELCITDHVELLPSQTRSRMAELFRGSRVSVSATIHDGTPNTLLEAMACGCLPVASDIESIREWITPGKNGLLFDPADHHSLAQEILHSLEDEALCQQARKYNANLIAEKASYPIVMAKAKSLYESLISRNSPSSK